ncbi:hypothetical protein [Sandaracinus amylolyticus]|uniref:Uncharacterized protein n=1 Tax=Sandaracinus amylolyticus TaxID=927083 RepID=A0A0F6W3Y1_9BACT|nr:hypothetical protein [Sandaracinus amylolyticus]AKF06786.1 hypothetical protein DB32_003935 [Sandaracinus amylolyticus]
MPLPPIDHVARALVAEGARDHAMLLLESAARRPGPDRGRCEALLGAMRARPHDSPSGPMVMLDAGLAEALAAAGMLVEARAVARGARIAAKGAVELAAALDQVLEAPPPSVAGAQRARWDEAIAGAVAAIEPLERELALCDPWLRARVPLAARLLRGFSVHAPTAAGASDEVAIARLPEPLRAAIAERVADRDLPGALAIARAAPSEVSGSAEIVAVLARIVAATERIGDEPPVASKGTVPLSGQGFVVFQMRMGNLAEAERALRRMVLEQANDHVARERLRDLIALRGVIDARGETGAIASEPPKPAGWLDKRKARPTGEGWVPGAKTTPVPPPKNEWDDEVATGVLLPEQEAELVLRSGHLERALEMYRTLLALNPARVALAAKVRDLELMIARGDAPLAGEATVRRDVSDIADAREARRSYVAVDPPTEETPLFDDDEPTLMGRRPKGLSIAIAPPLDPLAETQDRVVAPRVGEGVAVHRIVRIG